MKVQLFHAPYVDNDGVQRQRLCAVVTGCQDASASHEVLYSVHDALAKAEKEPAVLAFVDDVEVSWL